MHAKSKIRLDLIEQAHRALDALPEHRPEEVTKTQAIRKLIVPIRATQSKGYSLAAIGQVLAECGIPITTGALRAYISEARAGAEGKTKRKGKPAAKAPKPPPPAAPQRHAQVSPSQPSEVPTKPTGTRPTATVDLDWDVAARSDKATPSLGSASRQGFSIRPDTKDL